MQITIFYTQSFNGKWMVTSNNGVALNTKTKRAAGTGAEIAYMCTESQIKKLKEIYTWHEVSKY